MSESRNVVGFLLWKIITPNRRGREAKSKIWILKKQGGGELEGGGKLALIPLIAQICHHEFWK